MKKEHEDIDKILPYGELLRGFANQPYISKSDLKKFLRNRGIFFNVSEKENLVPCLATLLLSPSEFDTLREYQNTKEDNTKKNTSRLEWDSTESIASTLSNFSFSDLIPEDGVNFWFNAEPQISLIENNPNRVLIDFEIQRNDLNKSWYESTNLFKGKLEIEKLDNNEIKIIKSHTSPESNMVGENLQKSLVTHFKANNHVEPSKELRKILFGDFDNEDRIVFFYRLSSNMDSINFKFVDIYNMDFKPDPSIILPYDIDWMNNKSELKFKGNRIHDTFFIREKKYHKYLQFWEMESSFEFSYINITGSCNVIFSFRDFQTKGDKAEFEINISNFSIENGSEYSSREKSQIKNNLLDIFERKKDEIYKNFLEYVRRKNAIA